MGRRRRRMLKYSRKGKRGSLTLNVSSRMGFGGAQPRDMWGMVWSWRFVVLLSCPGVSTSRRKHPHTTSSLPVVFSVVKLATLSGALSPVCFRSVLSDGEGQPRTEADRQAGQGGTERSETPSPFPAGASWRVGGGCCVAATADFRGSCGGGAPRGEGTGCGRRSSGAPTGSPGGSWGGGWAPGDLTPTHGGSCGGGGVGKD